MAEGYMYLMVIIDLFSRYVLDWSVSNTMDAEWCNGLLKKTLATYPTPGIFNNDQGSPFTAEAFTATLKAADICISIDGKGRASDNIFVERLWRTVKYEHLYLYAYQDDWQLERRLLYVLQPETLPLGISLLNARSGIPSRTVSRKSSGQIIQLTTSLFSFLVQTKGGSIVVDHGVPNCERQTAEDNRLIH